IHDRAPTIQRAEVRPEELVDRAGDEVGIDRTCVERQVRRRVHRIDVQPRTRPVGAVRDLSDRVDGADGVRGPANGYEPSALVQQLVERVKAEGAVGQVRLPGADDRLAVTGGGDPRVDVRLVV